MSQTQEPSIESRTERSTIAMTPREKQALRFVAIRRQTSESELLRDALLVDIVAEYDRLMAALEKIA